MMFAASTAGAKSLSGGFVSLEIRRSLDEDAQPDLKVDCMKMPYLLLAIPGSIMATILAIAACAPHSTSIPVEIKPRTPLNQALEDCVSQVRQSQTIVVQNRTASMCLVPESTQIDEDRLARFPSAKPQNSNVKASTAEVSAYRLVNRPVRYSISNPSGRLRVGLSIGVQIPKEFVPEDAKSDQASSTSIELKKRFQQNLTWILNKQCLPKIQAVWARANIELSMQFKTLNGESDSATDQQFRLVSTGEGGEYPSLKVAAWPDRGELAPFARAEDTARCTAEKTSEAQQKCYEESVAAANDSFCLNLASMVGRWLGLEGDTLKSTRCTAEKTVADVRPSYMKAASRAEEQATFWQTAQLSSADMKTLLSPICRSFQQKDVTLHSNLAVAR